MIRNITPLTQLAMGVLDPRDSLRLLDLNNLMMAYPSLLLKFSRFLVNSEIYSNEVRPSVGDKMNERVIIKLADMNPHLKQAIYALKKHPYSWDEV
jgi:hypothetical protein